MLDIPTKPWGKLDLISADDHIIEPAHVWTSRATGALKAKVPHVVPAADGTESWQIEGKVYPNIGLNAQAGKKFEEYSAKAQKFSDMRPGCYDPAARVKDMDLDGIRTQISFPSVPGIGGEKLMQIADPEVRRLSFQAYNDWLIEEYQGPRKGRLIGLGILPMNDPDEAEAELRRIAKRGIKSLSIPAWLAEVPGCKSIVHPQYDPVWSLCEEYNLPINLHIAGGRTQQANFLKDPLPGQAEVFLTESSLTNFSILAWIVWGGLLARHPKLVCVSSEGGIGWVPYFLERADHAFNRHRFWMKAQIKELPSSYFHRQCYVAFIEDYAGIFARSLIGVENILWESDYPHTDTTWPFSHQAVDKSLKGVPEDERRKIVYENARRVYHLD
ncbi:MAG: amidohydrolase [Chloroflexi bacterium]|nr:amidohydrolase [Chloroflexota bacterium]